MRSFISGLATGIFSTVVGYFIFSENHQPHHTLHDVVMTFDKSCTTSVSSISAPIKAYRIREEMREEIAPPISSASTMNNDKATECNANIASTLQRIDAIAKKDPNQLNKELKDTFSLEPVDPEWSLSYEKKLDLLIRNHDELRNNLPDTIECRSTQCFMNIRYYSAEERDHAAEELLKLMASNTSDIKPDFLISNNDSANSLEIIVNR